MTPYTTMTEPRRFPPPWRADKMPGGYVVRDADGQATQRLGGGGWQGEVRTDPRSGPTTGPGRPPSGGANFMVADPGGG
jgi:hypothetical protein